MDKKIIKTMFDDIVSRDDLRPLLKGVHFEAERCYATDTHVLVIYSEGNEKLAGQTVSREGEPINGNFPCVDRVIPQEYAYGECAIDLPQLLKALQWHNKQADKHEDDIIVIGDGAFNMGYLRRLFNLFSVAGELNKAKFFLNDCSRASKLASPSLLGLVMPFGVDASDIDKPREYDGSKATFSYETVVNDYVFKSWKKEQSKEEPLSWL